MDNQVYIDKIKAQDLIIENLTKIILSMEDDRKSLVEQLKPLN